MTAVPARTGRLAALVSEHQKTRALIAALQSAAARVRHRAPLTAQHYDARAAYFEGLLARLNAQISTLGEG